MKGGWQTEGKKDEVRERASGRSRLVSAFEDPFGGADLERRKEGVRRGRKKRRDGEEEIEKKGRQGGR